MKSIKKGIIWEVGQKIKTGSSLKVLGKNQLQKLLPYMVIGENSQKIT